MSERSGEFERLTTDPAALDAYVFGPDGFDMGLLPIEDPARRIPEGERHALVHFPTGDSLPLVDYPGWPGAA